MKKLAGKDYWDSIYEGVSLKEGEEFSSFKSWIKNLTRDYSNFVMWDRMVPKYLPKNPNLKIIEIGCAPGKYLLNFKKRYGYEPYGVEYSEKGVRIARNNFEKYGINSANIIQADFFSEEFLESNREKFDLVFSRGFIEHYDDVKSVVDRHLDLIKSGGYVIVSIPSLVGLNKILAKFFNVDSYNLHNVSIMDKKVFADLFDDKKVGKVYCDYVGIFSFGLFNTNKKWKYFLHRILLLVQRPFDFLFRVLFKNGNLRHKYTSPYLMFIGRKK